jgi:hypothetical protein
MMKSGNFSQTSKLTLAQSWYISCPFPFFNPQIPYGNVAFLDAKFEKRDEFFVALGAEYFAKYNTIDAVAVLQRRKQMVTDLLRDVEDEIDVNELTRRLKIFDSMENLANAEAEGSEEPQDAASAIDIREDLTTEDEELFNAYKKRVSFTETSAPPKPPVATSPLLAVKERVVERKPTRPIADPARTATAKQVREQMCRKALRKDASADSGDAEETLSPR